MYTRWFNSNCLKRSQHVWTYSTKLKKFCPFRPKWFSKQRMLCFRWIPVTLWRRPSAGQPRRWWLSTHSSAPLSSPRMSTSCRYSSGEPHRTGLLFFKLWNVSPYCFSIQLIKIWTFNKPSYANINKAFLGLGFGQFSWRVEWIMDIGFPIFQDFLLQDQRHTQPDDEDQRRGVGQVPAGHPGRPLRHVLHRGRKLGLSFRYAGCSQ